MLDLRRTLLILCMAFATDSFGQATKKDWGSFKVGELKAENNVWGANQATHKQSIRHHAGLWKLEWAWPVMTEPKVRAYPQIIYGHKPWHSISTTKQLPYPLSLPKPVNIDLDIQSFDVPEYGDANLAFDIWLTDSENPTPKNKVREVMIWVDRKGEIQPAGAPRGVAEIAKLKWEVWITDDRTYIAFLPIGERRSTYQLPVHQFLSYLVNQGVAKSQEFVSSIEFGSEIFGGTGSAAFSLDIQH